ncbi:MAG: hypothetical protein CVV60_02525 [Tenericutes bacterium HGW-Tenericutes-5]|jgi:acetyl esterase/lipase|nr:MAG: hypothetical protein CVV60_02525 [Tenericutes bacterium HGW-Tenericutes-5]
MIVDHKQKISFRMFVIISLLTLISRISGKKLWSFVVNKKQKFVLPLKKHKTDVFLINGINIIKFSQNVEKEKFIIYFHGGGFVMSGNRRHHNFIKNFNQKTNFTSYYVEYPLAPKNKASDVIKSLEEVIKEIKKNEANKDMILMGDSAGGNLALVLSNYFSDSKLVFLLSPWLDLTMTNSEIEKMEKQEIMFSKKDLLDAAHDYQGNLDLNHRLISPIYDKFNNKQIKIFAGTEDLLFPDVVKFTETRNNVDLHQYHGLNHDFMFMFSGREQKSVIEDMVFYVKETK